MAARSTVYQDGDAEIIADINVTPLVDVVLVLLVIFMITAPILAARGILVNAPSTVSGEQVSAPLQLALRREAGSAILIYVNGRRQPSYDAARAELERARAGDPEVKAVIAADTEIPYGEVMKAIDQVKRAGIQKFALASKRPQDDRPR
jgi:biopolymer transport protein ExbD